MPVGHRWEHFDLGTMKGRNAWPWGSGRSGYWGGGLEFRVRCRKMPAEQPQIWDADSSPGPQLGAPRSKAGRPKVGLGTIHV